MEPTNQKETGQEAAKLTQVIQIDEAKIRGKRQSQTVLTSWWAEVLQIFSYDLDQVG